MITGRKRKDSQGHLNQAIDFKKIVSKRPKYAHKFKGNLIDRAQSKKLVTVTKQLNKIKKQLKTEYATVTRCVSTGENMTALTGQAVYHDFWLNSLSLLQTALGTARIYDASADALQAVDLTAGTYTRKIDILNIQYRAEIKNNSSLPCRVEVLLVTPKLDTNVTPNAARTGGLVDQGGPTASNTMLRSNDSELFNQSWAVTKRMNKTLLPGSSLYVNHTQPRFKFDPSLADTQSFSYSKLSRTMSMHVRLQGVTVHGVVAQSNNINHGPAYVDVVFDRKYKIKYDAGKRLRDFVVSDGKGAITAGTEINFNRPTNDGQGLELV